MRIHHLNCGSHCPIGGAIFDGSSRGEAGSVTVFCSHDAKEFEAARGERQRVEARNAA